LTNSKIDTERSYLSGFWEKPGILLLVTVICLFLWIIHGGLTGANMEPDGVIYASIARHLAEGQGSFWFPYSMFNEPAFHHHPPLALGLQSLLFSAFGHAFYVENLYQLSALLILIAMMLVLWKDSTGSMNGGWVMLFLFFLMPVISFSFTNNFLENTVVVFTTGAVLCQMRSFGSNWWIPWLVCSALLILVAVLTKGPVGLFPLVTVIILGIVNQKAWRLVARSFVVLLLSFCIGAALIWSLPEARQSLTRYFEYQLIGTLEGTMPRGHDRLYMLRNLATTLLLPVIIAVAVAWYRRVEFSRNSFAWLLIAFSASIPLLLSPRHFSQYIVPSLPFYALFLASIVGDVTFQWRANHLKILKASAAFMLTGLLVSSWLDFGKINNDFEEFHDLPRIMEVVPPATTIGICVSSDSIYRLLLYLSRYHSIRAGPVEGSQYVLCDAAGKLPPGFEELDLELQVIGLYQRQSHN